ncbi:hypothetical protein PROH_08730 [Prochlorothrix hollandica PCC 9006 = CALU 1027]|uniref:Uncharacterized protein n=2 Tax=Prochlorothrix hollandica TaxID=1223 RepID=A0A0M2PZT1_PROHO|nr:hypothetical protein [Prochlorothrix hollandica]KKI99886.1 hypothetical protein PROH_08730 [Prochlorothrix hollandica PCC 9006 = CALU 1027]
MVTKIELPVASLSEWEKQIGSLQQAETLSGMVFAVLGILRYLGKSLLEGELKRRNEAEQSTPKADCPQCGHRLESKGQVRRTLTTLLGKIA